MRAGGIGAFQLVHAQRYIGDAVRSVEVVESARMGGGCGGYHTDNVGMEAMGLRQLQSSQRQVPSLAARARSAVGVVEFGRPVYAETQRRLSLLE